MTPLHHQSTHWVRQGVFDNLVSFSDLEARINLVGEEKDRGDIFEIFIEGYLATQAITQHARHWVVGQIPVTIREQYNLPNDGTGIDGVFETHDGTVVAYQVKYRQRSHLTFAEVAPFLGITERFTDRVIFTNARSISHTAEARTRWYSGEMFAGLSTASLHQIEAWLKQQPVPTIRATPDPRHQVQALADIAATFADHDRATVVMACGTGKTLVALWAAEQAQPKTVLVLVPSLALLQQTLQEWSKHTSWASRFSYLCVCSDASVDKGVDALHLDSRDVGFRVDTDPDIVRAFLSRTTHDIRVVFATYHSTAVVAQGAKGLAPFDLGIFDEAHKTTGRGSTVFSAALSDDTVSIRKRLFLTATPRHLDIRKRDADGEFHVQSMDDEKVYGPRAHTLSFGDAARQGIICGYKVVISLIDKQQVDDFTRKNGITLVLGDEVGARWVANLIALEQAVTKVRATKIITFHSLVSAAQEFASSGARGVGQHLAGYGVWHVNGEQNSSDRSDTVRAFADAAAGLITNARCLTEGVDIPAVDMVAFIDPRQSKVDITQAVGRAMRKPRGATTKTRGYVLVPLFAGMSNESVAEAITAEKFDAVADVLNSLQEHDADLVDIIRELREDKGQGKPVRSQRLLEKLEVIGPEVGYDQLVASISVQVRDRLGISWDEWYGRLVSYKATEDHCLVPKAFKTSDNYKLGSWVSVQRTNAELSTERRARLTDIGFVWEPHEEQWEAGFSALSEFYTREDHCLVPKAFNTSDGYKLGIWVGTQRANTDLSTEKRDRLTAIGFIWDRLAEQWESGFSALLTFYTREDHCRVPNRFKTTDGFKLGDWVIRQRHNVELSTEKRARLTAIGFVWDAIAEQWETGFSALSEFYTREKHCLVPATFKTSDGYKLGIWVGTQRANTDLSTEKRDRLTAIGFIWDPFAEQWEAGFAALSEFYTREKHCRVPATFKTSDGFKLGFWVSNQRNRNADLSPEIRDRLTAIGFIWDALAEQWKAGFSALSEFYTRENHCRVPRHFKTSDGYKLGVWVSNLRRNAKLSPEKRDRLDAIGFAFSIRKK